MTILPGESDIHEMLEREIDPIRKDSPYYAGTPSRRRSVQADLGHELGEAGVGADAVGHGIDIEVDEPVDFFLEGKVQQAKRFVFFAQADMDSRRVQTRDELGSC